MSAQDNGGAAFPVAASEYGGNGPEYGMTLRDYFAAKADISSDLDDEGGINKRLAIELMDGETPPSWGDGYLAALTWWARAEARLRLLKADAMLLERAK